MQRKASAIKSKATALEIWLTQHVDRKYQLLNLSWGQFHDSQYISNGMAGGRTIETEDASYKVYIPEFMQDPNPYLNAHPEIKGLSLSEQARIWSPQDNMRELAANTTLEFLNLNYNRLVPDDIKVLASNNNIKVLYLASNNVGDGAAYFANNKVIVSLYIPSSHISKVGAQGIAQMSALKYLDISYNPITDADGAAIVNQCKNLQSINLEGTHIGKETVKALFTNKKLTDIQVDACQVGCINAWKLSRHAKANAKLAKLSNTPNTLFHGKQKEKPPGNIEEVKSLKVG